MKPPVIDTKYNTSSKSTKGETNSEESEETTDEEVDSEETEDEEETEDTESESEEEESDTSEEEGKQYLDLKTVPPQLQSAAKKMLASHTKTMQKLHKKYEGQLSEKAQELQDQYSEAIVKSAGFDRVIKLQGWQQFWDDVSAGHPYGYSSDFRKSGKNSGDEEDSSASDDEKTLSTKGLMKELLPAINKMIEDRVGPIRHEQTQNIWAEAEKNLPNFKKYKATITSTLTKHPTMSIQDAYNSASEKDRVNEAVQKALKDAQEVSKKIPGKTLKSGLASGGKRELSKDTIKSIDDALSFAKRDLIGASGG